MKNVTVNVFISGSPRYRIKVYFQEKHSLTPVPHLENATGLAIEQIGFHVCW